MIVETYEGFVEDIVGGMAVVRLRSNHGEMFYGRHPVSKFDDAGIAEHQPFLCHIVETNDVRQIRLEAIPEKESTLDRLCEIIKEADRALAHDGSDDDY